MLSAYRFASAIWPVVLPVRLAAVRAAGAVTRIAPPSVSKGGAMAIGFGPYWTGRGAGRLVVELDSPELGVVERTGMRERPAAVLHEGL